MGILQDPLKALEQVEWYLSNTHLEFFPGANELAAGALSRQTLEQILFLLCFYSGMPHRWYLRPDKTLRTAGELLKALSKTDSSSGQSYLVLARQAGPRIQKMARWPQRLKYWQHVLNEPAHFSPRNRTIDTSNLKKFVTFARSTFDEKDKFAISAAINEIMSGGWCHAVLDGGPDNTPGISITILVRPSNLERTDNGSIQLKMPEVKMQILPITDIPRGAWPKNTVVLVQHTAGMHIKLNILTRNGEPVDMTSMASVITSFAKTPGQRRYLKSHLRKLGFVIEFGKITKDSST